ncbi:MAG: zinc-dependent alcohol dehydrogenase [Beijerinckiaceae bacterium]
MAAKSGEARALWTVAAGKAQLGAESLPPVEAGRALIRTLWSGISRGTERLVFTGKVPKSEYETMRGPHMGGLFPFPVKYGYCAVGVVENGPAAMIGRTAFVLHPHQDRFVVDGTMVNVLPDALPPRRAVLAANMETALNAVWDSGASAGDRVVVVGAGVLGLLTASLMARLPGADVTVVDPVAARRDLVESFGAAFAAPDHAPRDADVVVHASANPPGLATALGCAGNQATVVELSWYGEQMVPTPLGGAFHAKRLRLISSQVGQIPPSRAPRWTYGRRMGKAMQLLCDARYDALITDEVAFTDLPHEMPRLLAPDAPGLTAVIRYS